MYTYESSEKIIKKFPWLKQHERDLESCIARESEFWQRESGGDFPDAVEKAHELMLEWIEHAHEFKVDDNLGDVASFVASHRSACVWAILISKHHRQTT